MITKRQIAMLHVAKSQLALPDDLWRDLLFAEARVRSSIDLDQQGFKRVLQRLEHDGFQNTSRRRGRPYRPNALVTPEQKQLIAQLDAQLGFDTLTRSQGFNRRCCRKAWPQTRADAIKCIEGRKAMLARQNAQAVTGNFP